MPEHVKESFLRRPTPDGSCFGVRPTALRAGDRITAVEGVAEMHISSMAAVARSQNAATAIEYAFVASLISIVIYAAANTIGTDLSSIFSTIASSL